VPSRRDQIRMSDEELRAFLAEQMIMSCATTGPNGRPHLISLWYVPEGDELRGWTYAKSQKARNLERDPRATLQVEAGETYDQLRGVMLRTRVDIDGDTDAVQALGLEIYARYLDVPAGELPGEVGDMIARQAPKRVALHFRPEGEPATWDHRKLGGVY
jgi:PPOX class probable F420-dependent enzyme